MRILGRKTATEPTPPMMPFTIKSFNAPSLIIAPTTSPSQPKPASIHSCGYAPRVKVLQNITNIRSRNKGIPNHLCVTTLSIIEVGASRRFSSMCRVSAKAPSTKPYFSLVIALSTSSSRSAFTLAAPFTACCCHCGKCSAEESISTTDLSPSKSLIAQ